MSPHGVTLKLATSLDGRIATASGESRWITGHEARRIVHEMRGRHQAVLVGIETVLADDPELTVRLDKYDGPQPCRVVMDSRQRLPSTFKLAMTARKIPTLVFSSLPPRPELVNLGVEVLTVKGDDQGRPDPTTVLDELYRIGIESILIEGGGSVAASFIEKHVVMRIEWFRAPIVLGAEGRPAIAALALSRLTEAPRFVRREVSAVGEDLWERYERV